MDAEGGWRRSAPFPSVVSEDVGLVAIMRLILTVAALCCTALGAANAQDIVRPEVVRLENVRVDDDMKIVTVGNAKGHYTLICSVKAGGCITPERNKNYLLFNKDTRWKMPGAKDFMTLAVIQDWTVKYTEGENIGLVAEDAKGGLGMFLLDRAGGGSARASDVDWKMYGFIPDKDVYCFYDAKGVAHTADRHIRVWTKCLSQKDLDSVDIKSELGKKIVESGGRKVAYGYVPPYALIEDINSDQALDVIRYEDLANLSDIRPQARFFYELNCSERMLRRLSTYLRIDGKDAFDNKPSNWQHISPESGGANLLNILCPR